MRGQEGHSLSTAVTRSDRRTRSAPGSEADPVRRVSVWLPGEEPSSIPLADIEEALGVRWVDIDYANLHTPRALGALNRVCGGVLTQRMARDLTTPRRFPAAGTYGSTEIPMTPGFPVGHLLLGSERWGRGRPCCRLRHLRRGGDGGRGAGPVGSVLKPVQLLIGSSWLLSAWLPTRLF